MFKKSPFGENFDRYNRHRRKKRLKKFYGNFIYFISIAAPIANLPQFAKVWISQDASGVSVFSWIFFCLISIAWFFYGVIYKDKHILIMNLALIFIQASIALGAFIYG